jgi:OmpA-OmpF porin, OOP family
MKKLTWSCFAAAFLATSMPAAYAQSNNVLEGAYVGLGLGATRARFVRDDFASNAANISESKDSTDKGYKLVFGFKVDRHWAFEVARTNFGKFLHSYDDGAGNAADVNYKVAGWSGSVLGILPIGSRFALFGRLGQVKSNTTAETEKASGTMTDTLTAAGVPVSGQKTKWSTVLGVGAQIDFPGRLGLRVEVEDYGNAGDQDNTGRARMRMASASLMYRF